MVAVGVVVIRVQHAPIHRKLRAQRLAVLGVVPARLSVLAEVVGVGQPPTTGE